MKKYLLFAIAALITTGCGMKPTPPVQLEKNDSENINFELLKHLNETNTVPKDTYLSSREWIYRQYVTPSRYYFPNERMIETFYLAHHANVIYIYGRSSTIKRYKKYFQNNQVTARIILRSEKRKNVRIIYNHKMNVYKNTTCCKYHGKETGKKPHSSVASIQ
jgi:hypothetical protein